MKEFCELTWDEPFFAPSLARVVFSNTDGNIVGYSDNKKLLDDMFDVLENSAETPNIAKEGSGMERILFGMYGIGGKYSSDNGFTESDFIKQSKTLKFKKELKIN